MKLGIFAASKVGYEIVRILVDNNADIECLIVDEHDNFCSKIIEKGNAHNTYYYSDLANPKILCYLRSLNMDLGMLAWWGCIIKKPIIDLFSHGMLNTHPSFLPYNRGKQYYFWNIVEEVPFGVSIHYVDEEIDHGDIAFQKQIEVTWEDKGIDLWEKAQDELIQLFGTHVSEILEGNIPRTKQRHENGSLHYSHEVGRLLNIDLEKTYKAKDLINIIRGYSGFEHNYPHFYDKGKKYCINVQINEKLD